MSPPPKAGVFISYARSDGEELARDLRQRLTAEAISLWRDREGMEGGRDWWMQIWDVQAVQDFWESAPGDQKLTELEWELILKPVVLEEHTRGVNDCAIASDSSFVVSASSDRTLNIWDVATGAARRTLTGHRRDVYGCAIAADTT